MRCRNLKHEISTYIVDLISYGMGMAQQFSNTCSGTSHFVERCPHAVRIRIKWLVLYGHRYVDSYINDRNRPNAFQFIRFLFEYGYADPNTDEWNSGLNRCIDSV